MSALTPTAARKRTSPEVREGPFSDSCTAAKQPDKTFIGRIERGFDFLGYHFSPAGMKIAAKTIANFIEKASRLYEQKRRVGSARATLEIYARRWVRWTTSGRVDLLDHWDGLLLPSALK